MYHDYAGQEIEDIEMAAIRQDARDEQARAKVTPHMLNDAYCHIEPTATEWPYLDNEQIAKYQEMATYLNQRLDGEYRNRMLEMADCSIPIKVTLKIRCKNLVYRRQLAAWNWLAAHSFGLVKHHWF